MLNRSESTVYKWIGAGLIDSETINGSHYISQDEIDRIHAQGGRPKRKVKESYRMRLDKFVKEFGTFVPDDYTATIVYGKDQIHHEIERHAGTTSGVTSLSNSPTDTPSTAARGICQTHAHHRLTHPTKKPPTFKIGAVTHMSIRSDYGRHVVGSGSPCDGGAFCC